MTTYITKGAPFFSGSPLLRTLQLSVLAGEQSWDGDLLGSFPGRVRARTKHVEKTCGDLWGQLTILEAVIGKTCDREGLGHYICYWIESFVVQ